MSKIFYDSLIILDDLEREVALVADSPEEKEEIWNIIDEMIHHKALGCILEKLPQQHHREFLDRFSASPQDESLFEYLKEKIGENVEELLKQEIGNLAYELLAEFRKGRKV